MDITITLNQEEILGSICNFLRDKNVVTDDKNIEINLVAGRGSNGHSAVISIKDSESKGVGAVVAAAKLTTTPEPDTAAAPPPTRRTRGPAKAAGTEPPPPPPTMIPDPPDKVETVQVTTEPTPPTAVPTETVSADEMTSDFDENGVSDNLFSGEDNSEEVSELFGEPGEQPQPVESLFS